MPKRSLLNRHQHRFLKNLRLYPEGLPQHLWPRPAALARWLDEEPFRQRLQRDRSMHQFLARLAWQHASSQATRQLSQAMNLGELSQVGPLLRVAKGQ
jgi:hypothetical protein